MLQNCYKVAVDLRTFQVAGKPLKPFTLWHWRTLDAFGSAFTGDGDFDFSNVALFCAVCSFATREEITDFLTGDYDKELAHFTRSVSENVGKNTADEIREYLEYYRQTPSRTTDKEPSQRAPVWGLIKSYLVEHCGYTNAEAWDCVVADAFCEIAYHSARHNDTTLDNELIIAEKQKAADGYKQPSQEELKRRMAGV